MLTTASTMLGKSLSASVILSAVKAGAAALGLMERTFAKLEASDCSCAQLLYIVHSHVIDAQMLLHLFQKHMIYLLIGNKQF
jgi:hypothetical protein